MLILSQGVRSIYWNVLKGGTLFLLVSLDFVQSDGFVVFDHLTNHASHGTGAISSSSVIIYRNLEQRDDPAFFPAFSKPDPNRKFCCSRRLAYTSSHG